MNIDNIFSNIDCVTFEVTQKCNLRCSYCFQDRYSVSHLDDMSNRTIEKSIDYINKIIGNNQRGLTVFFFGGEPLLNLPAIKLIYFLIEKLKKNKILYYKIITNGTVLDDEIEDFIVNNKIDLQISLDGNEKTHDCHRKFITGNGSFSQVVKNIKKLYNRNEEYFHKHVSCKGTYTKETIPITEAIFFFKKFSIEDYSLSPVTNVEDPLPLTGVKEQVKNIFLDTKKRLLRDYQKNILTKKSHSFIRLKKISYLYLFGGKQFPCSAGRKYISIGFDGKVYPCHRYFGCYQYIIDDVFGRREQENESLFDKYNLNISQKYICKKCEYNYWCGGTCANLTSLKMDPQYVDPVYCAYNKNTIIESIKLFNEIKENNSGLFKKILSLLNIDSFILPENAHNCNKYDYKKDFCFMIYQKTEHSQKIDLDDDGILFLNDEVNEKYIANTTTMAIWDLLDGNRTAEQITQEIANVCEVEFETIKDDIYGQLAAFQELGLVEEVQAESHA